MLGKYISISVHFRTEKHDYKAVRREINPCIYTSAADFYNVLMTFQEEIESKYAFPAYFFFNENPYPFLNLNQLWNAAKEEALK